MPFKSDDSEWPILQCWAIDESTDDDVEQYVALLTEKLSLREHHALIVDATGGKGMKGTHRKKLASFNKKNAAALSEYRVGLAFVSGSAAMRGIVTAIYWLSPPPFPYRAFGSRKEAFAWANTQLVKARSGDF